MNGLNMIDMKLRRRYIVRGLNMLDEEDMLPYNEKYVMPLEYDPEINRFRDQFGGVVHDIYRLITPSQYLIFRKYKNIYLVPDITNSFLVEMIYPEEEYEC